MSGAQIEPVTIRSSAQAAPNAKAMNTSRPEPDVRWAAAYSAPNSSDCAICQPSVRRVPLAFMSRTRPRQTTSSDTMTTVTIATSAPRS